MIEIVVKFKASNARDTKCTWEIYRPIKVTLSDKSELMIPAGFETDFASVPRIFWSLFPPIGKFNLAALIHDYCYRTDYKRSELGTKAARKWADKEFHLWLNKLCPKQTLRNYIMYQFVRWFGGKIYIFAETKKS